MGFKNPYKYPYKSFQSTKIDMPLSYKIFTLKITDANVNKLLNLTISVKTNMATYAILVLCAAFISYKNNKNIFVGIITLFWVVWMGYWAHVMAHNQGFLNYFTDEHNIFSFNPLVHKFSKDFFHFHDKVHHNSDINKDFKNIIIEIVQNILFQGVGMLGILIIQERMMFSKGSLSIICKPIFLFWACFYATAHMINFNIIGSEIHTQHHQNKYTNYDFDIFDIIHSSKTTPIIQEDLRHTIINAIVLTYVIIKYRVLFD
jgi:hypothetical protein